MLQRTGRLLGLVACVALLLAFGTAPGQAQGHIQGHVQSVAGRRVALIVGNGGYRNVDRLANPASDARLMARTLQGAGFTLIGDGPQLDLDKPRFDRIVQAFGRAVQGADVALFYYSGHGMQVQGVNWLVPVDANPTGARDLDFQMVDASLILRQMEGAGTKLNMLILDACRNNPFASRGVRSSASGLAEMRAPEGTLISYATQPGNVAADGGGSNSPYTAALAAAMRQPGLDVFRVFNQVGLSVKEVTGGQQQPWLASSPISGNFYFFGPVTVTPQGGASDEAVFWQSVSGSRNPADVQAYLRRYPNGVFAELAQQRLAGLAAAPPALPGYAAPSAGGADRGGRFDGTWAVTVSCERGAGGAAAWRRDLTAAVRGGVLRGTTGTPGQPSYIALEGTIQPDGGASLTASGLTGNPTYTLGQVNAGTSYAFPVQARFNDQRGTGNRTDERRQCTVSFARQ